MPQQCWMLPSEASTHLFSWGIDFDAFRTNGKSASFTASFHDDGFWHLEEMPLLLNSARYHLAPIKAILSERWLKGAFYSAITEMVWWLANHSHSIQMMNNNPVLKLANGRAGWQVSGEADLWFHSDSSKTTGSSQCSYPQRWSMLSNLNVSLWH